MAWAAWTFSGRSQTGSTSIPSPWRTCSTRRNARRSTSTKTTFFIVSEMLYNESDHRVVLEQLSMFLGAHYVITIQEESEHDVFQKIRERLRSGRGFARTMQADYLAYALLDATVDQFYPTLESVADSLEDLEERPHERPSKDLIESSTASSDCSCNSAAPRGLSARSSMRSSATKAA